MSEIGISSSVVEMLSLRCVLWSLRETEQKGYNEISCKILAHDVKRLRTPSANCKLEMQGS